MALLPHRWEWKRRSPDEMPKEIKHKLAYTEVEILGGQVHQATVYEPVGSFLGGLIAAIVLAPRVSEDNVLAINFLVFAVLALGGRLTWKWYEWRHSLFFFTAYRIIYIHGIVTRKIAMLPISKVTDMRYDRTPGGQLLRYGTFIIESAGQEQALRTLKFVPDPDNTYKQIQDWLFGKGTTNVNIIDVNMKDPDKSVPVSLKDRLRASGTGRATGTGATIETERPWWNRES